MRAVIGLSVIVVMTASLATEGTAAQGRPAAPAAAAAVPTPRTPDGKPDLSGRWGGGGAGAGGAGGVQAIEPGGQVFQFEHYTEYSAALAAGRVSPQARIIGRQPNYRHGNNLYSERDAGFTQRAFGNPPLYKPEFWEKVHSLDENGNKEDTTFSCFPAGVPRLGPPMRIVQTPTDIILMYRDRNMWRAIPTDGRPHDPVNSQDQTFNGDAVGRWEGDTLVIDVVGFNDVTWLGWPGWFHTNNMRVEERLRREGNTLHYEATVFDPDVLMEPWTMDPRALPLNTGGAPYLEDPPCLDFDLSHMLTRERG
ncbi:MAG: hypothetical protein HY824_04305 [Acidobacteria bacterium]|nr:hypothetical protein [Acidobacteriota bacterium]